MENSTQGFNEIITQHPDIARKSTFFGLFSHLVYLPTNSRLHFFSRFYGSVVRDELKDLFRLDDEAFAKRINKDIKYEQAYNGNVLVEGFVSVDKQFVALRLLQYAQIDYQPVSDIHYMQGNAATQAAKTFDL